MAEVDSSASISPRCPQCENTCSHRKSPPYTPLETWTAWLLFLYPFISISTLAIFISELPTIISHRLSKSQGGHWTGRWAEIPTVCVLGSTTIAHFYIFWWLGRRGKVRDRAMLGIHSMFISLLIWVLVIASCAGNSKLWLYNGVILECDTLRRNGPNCGIYEMMSFSRLQRTSLAFLAATL